MKPTSLRTLVALLALACAGTRAAPATALVLAPLAVWLHGSDHAHAVTLVADEGHLHLVLSHRAHAHHREAPGAEAAARDDADHVFHLAKDDAAAPASRRDLVDPPAAALPVHAWRPVVATTQRLLPPRPAPLLTREPLGTVVLRL